MVSRNMKIYFRKETYIRLHQATEKGKLSKFVNEAVEEKLQKTKKMEREVLKKRLIEGYKKVAKSKEMRTEDKIWEGTIEDGIDDE